MDSLSAIGWRAWGRWLSPAFWLAAALGSACTSVRWRDARGWEHQVGLFAYRIDQLERGTSVVRTSLGIDWRLSGHERGVSLGWKQVTERIPEVQAVEDPRELPECVAQQMRGERVTPAGATTPFYLGGVRRTGDVAALPQGVRSESEKRKSRFGFLYLETPPQEDPVIVESRLVGLQWRQGDAPRGFFAGYASSFQVVGRALEDDVALIRTWTNEPDARESLVLYTLDGAPRNESPPGAEERSTM